MSDLTSAGNPGLLLRCARCNGHLESSGREPFRFVCPSCGQHYFVVLQMVPVSDSRAENAGESQAPK